MLSFDLVPEFSGRERGIEWEQMEVALDQSEARQGESQ